MGKASGKRAKKVAVIANCLINQNAKVYEFAFLPAMVDPLVDILRQHEYGLLQLPCPELTYIGVARWWAVREQYDNPAYRRHAARILEPIVGQVDEYVKHGHKVVVVGLDGSPSCGVHLSGSSEQWGGRPEMPEAEYPVISARGVYIDEL